MFSGLCCDQRVPAKLERELDHFGKLLDFLPFGPTVR
jgi:hypothetical protein